MKKQTKRYKNGKIAICSNFPKSSSTYKSMLLFICSYFFGLPFYSACGIFFLLFICDPSNMKKRRSSSHFGGPASFSGSTLPTYEDVGKQWMQCRLDLESAAPGTRVANKAVAKQVCNIIPSQSQN